MRHDTCSASEDPDGHAYSPMDMKETVAAALTVSDVDMGDWRWTLLRAIKSHSHRTSGILANDVLERIRRWMTVKWLAM